jgi:hypothetical protein
MQWVDFNPHREGNLELQPERSIRAYLHQHSTIFDYLDKKRFVGGAAGI